MHTLNKNVYTLAICLSALAGCVDALGFLQLGGYFISFMSGNSTRLAVNLATGNRSGIALLAGILACFIAGVMIGTWVRHFSKPPSTAVNVLACVTLLLACAALSYEKAWGFSAIAFMTLAMGAENAVLQRNGDVVVGLTYMTGTLVKFGQRLAHVALGGAKLAWVPYLLLWLGLISGGIAGAALFHFFGLRSLWFAVAGSAGLTIAATRLKHCLAI